MTSVKIDTILNGYDEDIDHTTSIDLADMRHAMDATEKKGSDDNRGT